MFALDYAVIALRLDGKKGNKHRRMKGEQDEKGGWVERASALKPSKCFSYLCRLLQRRASVRILVFNTVFNMVLLIV
mgnify:CR=1 FL=1